MKELLMATYPQMKFPVSDGSTSLYIFKLLIDILCQVISIVQFSV